MLRVLLVLFAFIYPESHQQCLSGYTAPEATQVETWNRAQWTFASDLFRIVSNTYKNENVILSPFSVYHTMLLVYFGAFRQTEIALKNTLRIPRQQKRNDTWNFYQYDQYLFHSTSRGYTMKSIEKLYFSLKYQLEPCMEDMFEMQLEKVSGSAVNIVNNWVKKITNGIISNLLVTLFPLTPVTVLYIKGNWQVGFSPDSIKQLDFYETPTKAVPAKMMQDHNVYETGYSANLKAFTIILPFEGRDAAMILLLPEIHRDGDVNDLTKRINWHSLKYVTNRTRYRAEAVSIVMPKFTSTLRLNLKDPLLKMGAMDSFVSTADYSRFTGRREVFMEHMIHQAAIEVVAEQRESGQIIPRLHSSRFICNRPFVYLVYDFSKYKLLMMGIFRKP